MTTTTVTTAFGQEFEICGSDVDKSTFNSNLLEVYFNVVFMFDIHVSCSKPIDVGVTSGNYLEVTGGHLKNGVPCAYVKIIVDANKSHQEEAKRQRLQRDAE
jgi:hypothetical protein